MARSRGLRCSPGPRIRSRTGGKGHAVGVLQRFERRLGGLVEGAFARVFGGVVQPVEVAAALQREAEDKKAVVGQGRILVPNDYVVELGDSDHARLAAYDGPLRRELAAMVSEHAGEQGWSFVGPVGVRLEKVDDLSTGVFRIRSAVLAAEALGDAGRGEQGAHSDPARPYLVIPHGGSVAVRGPQTEGRERVVPLAKPVTRIGRGADADVRLADTGVSRLHAEIRLEGERALLVDMRSTNGTTVNGRRVQSSPLNDGDRIGAGATALVFRQAR